MTEKTVAQKLFIKENYDILLINEPKEYRSVLGNLPDNTTIKNKPKGKFDIIQFFVTTRKEMEDELAKLKNNLKREGMIWITYPKGTSKIDTDINRDLIREYASTIDLKTVFQVSIGDTWSALRLKVV